MNITQFAEQIVFGTTLDDKLQAPGKLTFDRPASPIAAAQSLVSPGRSAGLRMRHDKGGNVQPPSDNRLENEQARGQLLHFLANHELLATELMALVLLKFPDAPHAFRQGVLVTLQEEQEHTRMYIRRMKECGVEFGQYPLSGQFWRVVEPMKSPMDFVSRLSLTFEQANLDYSLHFANVFKTIGDDDTSAVLQQIYQDEIGHVKHGLHWFRQWKQPDQSDWQAYQASLDFPMSPQRARGPRASFNRQGRMEAGLTEDFIDSIEVFRQSRGRPPTVRWFDPAAEAKLDRKLSPKEERLMYQIGCDLEGVMVALARQDDAVLVRQMPSQSLRKHWIDAGFDVPEFVPFEDQSALADRNLHNISPWSSTPESIQFAKDLCDEGVCNSIHQPPPAWNESWRTLYRKSFVTACLQQWEGEVVAADVAIDPATIGMSVRDMDDVREALDRLAKRSCGSAIIKRDLATSGRGQRRVDCGGKLTADDLSWLEFQFADASLDPDTGFVGVVEPELNRIVDLSFLWDWKDGDAQPKFLGWTRPRVTPGRRYCGTQLGNRFYDCDRQIKQFLLSDRAERLKSVATWLEQKLLPVLLDHGFYGSFGVDAMVYRDDSGELQIKPLVELNPRITMGHVALRLQQKLASGVAAEFQILTRAEWDELGPHWPKGPIERAADGHWKSGVIRFCDVDEQTRLIPLLEIGT